MEVIINSNSSGKLSTAHYSSNGIYYDIDPSKIPLNNSSTHIDYLISLLESSSSEIKLGVLQLLKKIILSISSKDSTFPTTFKKIFDKSFKLLLTSSVNNDVILENLLLNIYNLIVKLQQCDDSKTWKLYITDQFIEHRFVVLSCLTNTILSKARCSSNEFVKLHALLVICELSELKSTIINNTLMSLGMSKIMVDHLNQSVDFMTNSDQSLTNNKNIDKNNSKISGHDAKKLSSMLITKSLQFLSSTLQNGSQAEELVHDTNILNTVEKLLKSVNNQKLEKPLFELVYNLFSHTQSNTTKQLIARNSIIMKHCKKSLYISTALELSKIEIIIKYINKIVYNNDKHDLLLLSGLDLNYILLQILTERLANDKFFCENISIKFNIIGILGRLILVDEELFEIIVDDHLILIDMMINDYLSSSNLKFQQCMTFFLNSLLVAAQQYNNAAMKEHHIDVEEEKARKLAKIIYIDKLPILLSKFNDILQANDKLYPGSTQEDQVTMRMVKISIFEIMNLLIRGGTQFDKFQCIQYMCLLNYLEVLVTASRTIINCLRT